jgi:hypothetical protein
MLRGIDNKLAIGLAAEGVKIDVLDAGGRPINKPDVIEYDGWGTSSPEEIRYDKALKDLIERRALERKLGWR